MAGVTVSYKNDTILESNSSFTKALKTAGKYCDADILIEYVKSLEVIPTTFYASVITSGTDALTFTLDFEPTAFFVKCNEAHNSNYYDAIPYVTTNTLSLFNGFFISENSSLWGDVVGGNYPSLIWANKGTSQLFPRNLGDMMTKTQNTDGTWSVTLSRANTGTYSYRFVAPTNGYQIMFIGNAPAPETRKFSTIIYLTEDATELEFQTNFEPKFIYLSCGQYWSDMKSHLDEVPGKTYTRQIYYYSYCASNFLYAGDVYRRDTVAFDKQGDTIRQPATKSHVTTQNGSIYTTTISRADTATAAWRFAGDSDTPVSYNILVLG